MTIWKTVCEREERALKSVPAVWRLMSPRRRSSATCASQVTISSWSGLTKKRFCTRGHDVQTKPLLPAHLGILADLDLPLRLGREEVLERLVVDLEEGGAKEKLLVRVRADVGEDIGHGLWDDARVGRGAGQREGLARGRLTVGKDASVEAFHG
jgi:hypothetical protein